jgi:hypothetical protein
VVGSLDVPGGAWSIAVDANDAYVSNESFFHVLDISNPISPVLLGSANAPGKLSISGRYACTTGQWRLHALDISDPSSPRLLGTLPTRNEYPPVFLDGTVAFVGEGQNGLQVMDISQPGGPRVLGGEYTTSYGSFIHVGDYLFASGGPGLWVLPPQCTTTSASPDTERGNPTRSPRLLAPYPNPATGPVTIPVVLEGGDPVQLTVHDVAGRLVAKLVDGVFSGDSRLVWSGRNGLGRRLPAGMYVVRLETPHGAEARKLVLRR